MDLSSAWLAPANPSAVSWSFDSVQSSVNHAAGPFQLSHTRVMRLVRQTNQASHRNALKGDMNPQHAAIKSLLGCAGSAPDSQCCQQQCIQREVCLAVHCGGSATRHGPALVAEAGRRSPQRWQAPTGSTHSEGPDSRACDFSISMPLLLLQCSLKSLLSTPEPLPLGM